MTPEQRKLAADIYRVCRITGQFTLRSGLTSNEYFDKYLFESEPRLLSRISHAMIDILPLDELPAEFVHGKRLFLAGLEMGGIPIATVMSHYTGFPALFVRKQAKEYGTCKLAEGQDFKGKALILIEDVVTTGGQVIKSADQLRELGAEVSHVVAVIDREKDATTRFQASGLKLRALFTATQLAEASLTKY